MSWHHFDAPPTDEADAVPKGTARGMFSIQFIGCTALAVSLLAIVVWVAST